MFLRRDQDPPRHENGDDIGREILLMFTLSGFGGAAALSISETKIDPISISGAARPRSGVPQEQSQD